MAKTRVYELAKELDVQPKDLLDMLKIIGVSGKVPSSSIEETAARALRQMVANRNNPPQAPVAPSSSAPASPKSFKKFSIGDFRHRPVGSPGSGTLGSRPSGSMPSAGIKKENEGGAGTDSGEATVRQSPGTSIPPSGARPPVPPDARPPVNAQPVNAQPVNAQPVNTQPAGVPNGVAKAPVRPTAPAGPTPGRTMPSTPMTPNSPTASAPAATRPAASAPAPGASATSATPPSAPAPIARPPQVSTPPASTAPTTGYTSSSPSVSSDEITNFRDKDVAGAPANGGAPSAPVNSRPAPSGRFARARSIGRGSTGGRRGRQGMRRDGREGPRFGDKDFQPENVESRVASRNREGGKTVITIPPTITIAELAEMIDQPPATLIKRLFMMNIIRSANQPIEADVAGQLLSQFGFAMELEQSRAESQSLEEETGDLVDVPPVVTIMGHVDHGKTSLLDIIRSANVQKGEAGGITQRIGAYETEHNGHSIVFLDTPGHEAFTRMRARGAHVTDIAVLVVAADDGVMPQTREAIDHARAAKVPIIVAMNKMDRAEADPNRVKGQLAEVGLIPEDYGGETIVIPVSAVTGQGVQDLLDMILLVAELEELKANPEGPATGTIIEARQDTQRGPVATVLVHRGTLRQGDHVVVGDVYGRVRTMLDYKGDELKEAGPKRPVSVTGLSAVPHASDMLQVVSSSREAREQATQFAEEAKEGRFVGTGRISLNELFAQIQKGDVKDLNVVVKADGQGSVEALCQSLEKQQHEEVRVRIIARGVGNVTESDVMLASASNAIIIAFAVGVDYVGQSLADREGVEVRTYDVIYDALNDVHDALEGMLAPVFEERLSGEAEVRALFKSSRAGTIAGCMVTNGKLISGSKLRVLRGPKRDQVFEGKIDSLRHIKQVVKEVSAGSECGVSASNFNDFQEGDILHSVVQEQIKRTLNG